MPASVRQNESFGVTEIVITGKITFEWKRMFWKKKWVWHPPVKIFTKACLEPETFQEAQQLAETYNNRFK